MENMLNQFVNEHDFESRKIYIKLITYNRVR